MYCLDLYLSCWCTAWFCLSAVGVLPGFVSQLLGYYLVLSLSFWCTAWFCLSTVGVLPGFVSQLLECYLVLYHSCWCTVLVLSISYWVLPGFVSQLLVYCLVRELPNTEPLDRVKDTLRQYDILPKNTTRATEEQTTLENLFHKRVIAMKGGPSWHILQLKLNRRACEHKAID